MQPWRREESLKIGALQVFAGLEILVDLDRDQQDPGFPELGQPGTNHTEIGLDISFRSPVYNCNEDRFHSNVHWTELKRASKTKTFYCHAAEGSTAGTPCILPSNHRLEGETNDDTKARHRTRFRRKKPTSQSRSSNDSEKVSSSHLPSDTSLTSTTDSTAPHCPHDALERQNKTSAGSQRSTKLAEEPSSPTCADASSRRESARRVRFAAQLEEDPPAAPHAPPSARPPARARGAYAARVLRAVSRSFSRALRRAPD
jgi:hypothetical protein